MSSPVFATTAQNLLEAWHYEMLDSRAWIVAKDLGSGGTKIILWQDGLQVERILSLSDFVNAKYPATLQLAVVVELIKNLEEAVRAKHT